MPRLSAVPTLDTPDRRVFDQAKMEGNDILAQNIQLDYFIQELHRRGTEGATLPNFSHIIDQRKEETRHLLEKYQDDASVTWTDFYRLLSHQELLDEIVYAPLVFNRPDRPQQQTECEQLVDGVFGLNAAIIESALEQYDHPHATSEERRHLKGVINEHVAMALLNFEQRPDQIARPSPVGSDLRRKTDIIRHSVSGGIYSELPIQVKSHIPHSEKDQMTPEGGILVTANEMGNSERNNFTTARAIVAEVGGMTDMSGEKRQYYAEHLRLFHAHFTKSVDNKANLVRRKRETVRHISGRALSAA